MVILAVCWKGVKLLFRNWSVAVVSWYESVDEDGNSMKDRVIIQLLYLMSLINLVMLTVMSVRIRYTFSYLQLSASIFCWLVLVDYSLQN
jgi:hypothetical protein